MTLSHRLPEHLLPPEGARPSGVSFRPAVDDDLRPLHATFYAQQPSNKFRQLFKRVLAKQEAGLGFWLVGEIDYRLVSNAQLIIYPYGAELANVGVIAEYQNRGLGTAMIAILTRVARQVGQQSLEIGVADSNARARALYQRLGFAPERRLLMAGIQPALILRKDLNNNLDGVQSDRR